MAKNGPNKTVARFAARRTIDPAREAQKDEARADRIASDDFMQWMFAQAAAGKRFKDEAEARAAFDKRAD